MENNERLKTCFVIGPIGEESSDTRKRADQLLKYVIKPTAEAHNYSVNRADKLAKPGVITNQIIENIVEADLVIADLTERNPNVYYELAIRHGLQKPFIHIIDSSEKIPFDIAGVRAIQININDLDSVFKAKEEISSQITSINDGQIPIDNPISVSFDMQKLRESGKPSDRIQADIVQTQIEIQASIRRLEKRFDIAIGQQAEPSEWQRQKEVLQKLYTERKSLLEKKETFSMLLSDLEGGEREHIKLSIFELENRIEAIEEMIQNINMKT